MIHLLNYDIFITDLINASDLLAIIIITVVCCAVCTSIIWVVIIYHTRKRMLTPCTTILPSEAAILNFKDITVNQFCDNTSNHSSCKDSGTGDSTKRSNDDLLPEEEYKLILNGEK